MLNRPQHKIGQHYTASCLILTRLDNNTWPSLTITLFANPTLPETSQWRKVITAAKVCVFLLDMSLLNYVLSILGKYKVQLNWPQKLENISFSKCTSFPNAQIRAKYNLII